MRKEHSDSTDAIEHLRHTLEHAAHLLPMQGPIGVFIHHNTLHAFQHLPFERAVVEAAQLFGTEPYMREEQFREQFHRGRILSEDLDAVLGREANDPVLASLDRRLLRRTMLAPGVREFHRSTIRWELDEGRLLHSEEDRSLFATCLEYVESGSSESRVSEPRLRDVLLEATGDDLDDIVHPFLIRVCGAYLDQGLAYWSMPDREAGFYNAVRSLWRQPAVLLPSHLEGLNKEFDRQEASNMTADEVVVDLLNRLEAVPSEWERVITSELLALPGWAGLMYRLEKEPELAPHDRLPCSLMDYLAVRLTVEYVSAVNIAGDFGSLRVLQNDAKKSFATGADRLVRAAQVFEVVKAARIPVATLESCGENAIRRLIREIESFDGLERRRIWQLAYEERHERMILGPLGVHRRSTPVVPRSRRPAAQVFFCLDEREESIRRQLEEIAPEIETFGAAGFYGIAVDYAGIDDPHGVPLCPVVVKPKHAVRERPVSDHERLHSQRRNLRAAWASLARNMSLSSRTLVRGALSTGILGIFSLIPLIAHVLSPRQYARLSTMLNRWILPEPRTELTLMRTDEKGHDIAEHLLLGFTTEEKVDRVASVLAPAGLTSLFAPVVIVLGHGSTSLNNPHESAHDCGACGGRRGGPNGRLFAAMANRSVVRENLRERGIDIPDDTWFVGGYHDTCNDEIEYFDLESMPESFAASFASARATLDRARALDAHERSRRFEAAPDNPSPNQALWHVQERSEHLAEPRPEYGHCTNAVCIVGRRDVTRGLFLDRRAFLVSYDPTQDPTDENLAALLGAAIPVCGGISLEYYFSFVDNEGYGCGTKLPHNITGLVGVMNGHASDLRTGLPWQMVEIHEPVRILFNIETTPERLMKVINASPLLREFVDNRWIRLSTLDPDSGEVHVLRNGTFEPGSPWTETVPQARSSAEWYRGTREHLPIAEINPMAASA
jgi:uncharacterized protein